MDIEKPDISAIITALRCHMTHGPGCKVCPYLKHQENKPTVEGVYNCTDMMCKDAIDLITQFNRLTASYEKLKASNKQLRKELKEAEEIWDDPEALGEMLAGL
ncbi:MAG: hypothetical protein AB7C97_05660 [Oscillospiraceae bacterium]